MKYRLTVEYECEETTCGKMVEFLKASKGNRDCLGYKEFIEVGTDNDICRVAVCWPWIEAQKSNKKIILLNEIGSNGSFYEKSKTG
jgi:hypothetical protein